MHKYPILKKEGKQTANGVGFQPWEQEQMQEYKLNNFEVGYCFFCQLKRNQAKYGDLKDVCICGETKVFYVKPG